jgi:glycosyltransferase involved in cell wall biosynthesis
MDILMLTNKMPYPPKDGGSIATLSIARSFSELGHKVTILAMNTSKHHFNVDDIPANISEQIEFIGVDVNTDVSVWDALKNLLASSVPYNAQRFITLDYDRKLAEVLQSRKFDVVHLEGPYLGPYIRTIRKHTTALVSMRPQNVEHEIWQRTAAQSKGPKGLYIANLAKRVKRFEVSMLNNYDVMVPITKRDGDLFKKLGCKIPMLVTPTGIDTGTFKPDYENIDYPSLFHLGALDWPPNQEGLKWFFSKVWPKILKEFPDLKFYLAGRNAPPEFDKFSEPNVEFLGEVESAHDFIRSKTIMVVPLLSGSGMRIKIIEGMALGKAIITTSIGREGIDVTHKKNMMIADSPDEFLDTVRFLLSGKEKAVEMGKQAVEFVNHHYDNLSIMKALSDFYIKHLP